MYIYGHKVLQPKKYIIFCQYCVMINAYCHVFLAMCYVVRNKIQFIPESVPTQQPLAWTSLWGILFYSSNFFHYCYRYWSRLSEAFLKWVLSFFFIMVNFQKTVRIRTGQRQTNSCTVVARRGADALLLSWRALTIRTCPPCPPPPQKIKIMINKRLVVAGLGEGGGVSDLHPSSI